VSSLLANGTRLLAVGCLGMLATAGLAQMRVELDDRPPFEAGCSIAAVQPRVCVSSSLLITIHCRNDAQTPLEWLEPNDRRAAWELTRPDKKVERTSASRYTTSTQLISVAPGNELSVTIPVTRWFALADAGSYFLRFRLQDTSGALQIETNEIGFSVTPCADDAILTACRVFLSGQHEDFEAVAGFDSAAAVPCMQEALARNSTSSVSVIDGLARIQSTTAISILLKEFEIGNAFDRLAAWQALHRVNMSALSSELRQKVSKVLKETPITLVN